MMQAAQHRRFGNAVTGWKPVVVRRNLVRNGISGLGMFDMKLYETLHDLVCGPEDVFAEDKALSLSYQNT